MNYPKPEIQKTALPDVTVYLYVPQYTFDLQVSGMPAFWEDPKFIDSFSDFISSDEGMGLTGRVEPVSEPYEVLVTNNSNKFLPATILYSYLNRVALNTGNVTGIEVMSAKPGVTYNELMAQTEHKPCEIGLIQVQVLRKPDNVGFAEIMDRMNLTWKTSNASGDSRTWRAHSRYDARQADISIIENRPPAGITLTGFSGFDLMMLPNTQVLIRMFPNATRQTTNGVPIGRQAELAIARRQEAREFKKEARITRLDAKMRVRQQRRNG